MKKFNIIKMAKDLKNDITHGQMGRGVSVWKYLYYNYFCSNVVRYGNGKFIPHKNTIFEFDPTSKIYLYGDKNMEFMAGTRKGEKEKSYISAGVNSVWHVRNGGRLGKRSQIGLRDYAVLDTGFFTTNENCTIVVDKKVTLGDDIMIGGNVTIVDTDFHQLKNSRGEQVNSPKEVVIGDHVWLGANSVIWKGSVGKNSVVASYTVVKKRIAEGSMVSAGSDSVRVVPIEETIKWERVPIIKNGDVFRESNIILYGYGANGKDFKKQFKKQVCYVIDNGVKEREIYTFEKFRKAHPQMKDYIWVIASSNYYDEMYNQVKKYYPDMEIYAVR